MATIDLLATTKLRMIMELTEVMEPECITNQTQAMEPGYQTQLVMIQTITAIVLTTPLFLPPEDSTRCCLRTFKCQMRKLKKPYQI